MIHQSYSIGFVGGGLESAAGYAHFVASQLDKRWRLETGVFSKNAQKNIQTADAYGISSERVHKDFERFLQREAGIIDAVVLLTPTPSHYQMVKSCLEAGVPVICEKSLTMTSSEARDIAAVCERNRGFLAIIYNYSGYPMVRELKRMVRDGELGEILHFQAEMPQEGYIRTDAHGKKPSPQAWRLKDESVPTIHLDLAVHLHELIHYVTGLRPIEVVANQASRGWFNVVDNVCCLSRYTGNTQGQFWFSKCALGHRNGLRLRIYGSKASAEWFQANPEELLVSFVDGRRQIVDRGSSVSVAGLSRYTRFKTGHPAGFIEALANLYMDIHHSLEGFKKHGRQESDEVFGAELAIEGMDWLEAMVRSCSTGNWEKLPQ